MNSNLSVFIKLLGLSAVLLWGAGLHAAPIAEKWTISTAANRPENTNTLFTYDFELDSKERIFIYALYESDKEASLQDFKNFLQKELRIAISTAKKTPTGEAMEQAISSTLNKLPLADTFAIAVKSSHTVYTAPV